MQKKKETKGQKMTTTLVGICPSCGKELILGEVTVVSCPACGPIGWPELKKMKVYTKKGES